jgi:hypothetical protein
VTPEYYILSSQKSWSLRFEAEGREFAKFLGSLEQFSEKIVLNIEWSLRFEAEGREFANFWDH